MLQDVILKIKLFCEAWRFQWISIRDVAIPHAVSYEDIKNYDVFNFHSHTRFQSEEWVSNIDLENNQISDSSKLEPRINKPKNWDS